MEITVSRSAISGSARAPPSKSYTHRAILAAGYGEGRTVVRGPLLSADTGATARAVDTLAARVERGTDDEGGADDDTATLIIDGFGGEPGVPEDVLECANSGTTMRLVTATAALCSGLVVLTGDESLRSRPQPQPLIRIAYIRYICPTKRPAIRLTRTRLNSGRTRLRSWRRANSTGVAF